MKKLIIAALAILLVFTFASCDSEEGADVKPNNTETVGNIEADGEEAEKKAPVPSEEYLLWRETGIKTKLVKLYEYNEKGHLTKVTYNYPDGRVKEDIYEYTYDPDGSYSVHEDGHLISEKLSKYDAEGRLIEVNDGPGEVRYNITTYTYGDSTIELVKKDQDGYIKDWKIQTLNADGLIVKEEQLGSDGRSFGWLLYIYDENGNETAVEHYNAEGEKSMANAVYVWTEEYDEYGRVTRRVKGIPETGGYAKEELYEYDENGGMCKMTSSASNTVCEYRPISECIK